MQEGRGCFGDLAIPAWACSSRKKATVGINIMRYRLNPAIVIWVAHFSAWYRVAVQRSCTSNITPAARSRHRPRETMATAYQA